MLQTTVSISALSLRSSKCRCRMSEVISRSWVTSSAVELKTTWTECAKSSWFHQVVTACLYFEAARSRRPSIGYFTARANTLACSMV